MHLVYVAVTILAALVRCSGAVMSVVDPGAVLGPDVAREDFVVKGHVNEASTERLLREPRARKGSEVIQVDDEKRIYGLTNKVKSLHTTVSQSDIVGKAKSAAMTAAGSAMVPATYLAVLLRATAGKPLGVIAPLWNTLGNSPSSLLIKAKLMELSQTFTEVMKVGATMSTVYLETLASKFRLAIDGLLNKSASLLKTLAAHPEVMRIKRMLEELVSYMVVTAAILFVRVQVKKNTSKLGASIYRLVNKYSPYRKAIGAGLTSKTTRTMFAEKVTDVILQIALKLIKLSLGKHARRFKAVVGPHLNKYLPYRMELKIPTVRPKNKFKDLAKTVRGLIKTAVKFVVKVQVRKHTSNYKATIKKLPRESARYRGKMAANSTVKKIKAKIKKFAAKVADALMAIALSIEKILDKVELMSK